MAHPLDGVQAKIDHAGKHLDSLRRKLRAFGKPDDPYEVVFQEGDTKDIFSGHLHILREVPLEFGVLVGDIAHDLRSALDHLVYEVARLSVARPSNTQFPIYTTKKAYWEIPPKPRIGPRDSSMHGIPEEHRAFIDLEQPYLAGDTESVEAHPLRRLSTLSNRDKHRIVSEAFARPYSLRLRPLNGTAHFQVVIDREQPTMVDGSRIFVARVTERSVKGLQIKVDMQLIPVFGTPPLAHSDLVGIRTHVREIVQRFREALF